MKKKAVLIIFVILVLIAGIGYILYDKCFYTGELIGIKGTFTYHRSDCPFVKKINVKDLIFFESLQEAADQKYRSCKTCNPPSNKKELDTVLLNEAINVDAINKAEQDKYLQEQKKTAALEKRAEQFEKDFKAGKIANISDVDKGTFTETYYSIRRDLVRIKSGESPIGLYKNPDDAPIWYKDNKWNPDWENDDK